MTALRPKVITNFAITADGKVSTRRYTPTGFTSKADKLRLSAIRAMGDAVLAGKNTVEIDNMSMGLSIASLRQWREQKGLPSVPLRVLISNSGTFNSRWKVFQNTSSPIVIFSTRRMKAATQKSLAQYATLVLSKTPRVNLKAALKTLRTEYGIRTLVCEGGPGLFRSLLEAGAVDEIYLTIAPLIFGGKKAPTITGISENFLKTIKRFKLMNSEQVGDELFLHYAAKSS